MNQRKENAITREHLFRTMREMLLEAPPEEVRELAQDAGLDADELAKEGRQAAEHALQRSKQGAPQPDNVVLLHKGLHTLLVLLRRRDGLDEVELARKADVEQAEIRQIESQPGFIPHPRTIFKLEKQFGLPSGVLAKLSGAVKHNSPVLEEKAMEFAASAQTIGKLSRAERQLLNEFIKFLTEKG
jgi:ribosome-binding protein aMBF1 (putative translation factor)